MLFWPMFGNFWCSVVTLVTFISSNISNFEKTLKKIIKKNIYIFKKIQKSKKFKKKIQKVQKTSQKIQKKILKPKKQKIHKTKKI